VLSRRRLLVGAASAAPAIIIPKAVLGAVPTAMTTAAVNAAIASLAGTGGNVWLQPGVLDLSDGPIIGASNVTIPGVRGATIFRVPWHSVFSAYAVNALGCDSFNIRSVTFDMGDIDPPDDNWPASASGVALFGSNGTSGRRGLQLHRLQDREHGPLWRRGARRHAQPQDQREHDHSHGAIWPAEHRDHVPQGRGRAERHARGRREQDDQHLRLLRRVVERPLSRQFDARLGLRGKLLSRSRPELHRQYRRGQQTSAAWSRCRPGSAATGRKSGASARCSTPTRRTSTPAGASRSPSATAW
jgi:hypothetical protein